MMVQVPPTIEVAANEHKGNEAAVYLQGVVNTHAQYGWEYYRVDSIGVNVKPGCLGMLFGQKDSAKIYHVITFRKPA